MPKSLKKIRKILTVWCVSACAALLAPGSASAYPVDCAILLCLSGGWPASAPCAHARAVFIRRITPWPIEPPLQIWRCPLRAAMNETPGLSSVERRYKVAIVGLPQGVSPTSAIPVENAMGPILPVGEPVVRSRGTSPEFSGLVQKISNDVSVTDGVADVDISGPEFEFVRSIRVWDVQHFSHQERGRDDDCEIRSKVRLGVYGVQGDFHWKGVSYAAAPSWVLPDTGCSRSSGRRGVGVEWRDFGGNHGYEWVSY